MMIRRVFAPLMTVLAMLFAGSAAAFEQSAGTSAHINLLMPFGDGGRAGPHLVIELHNTGVFSDKAPWEIPQNHPARRFPLKAPAEGAAGFADFSAAQRAARDAAQAYGLSAAAGAAAD